MQKLELARELERCAANAAPLDRIASPRALRGSPSQSQPELPAQIPVDAAVAHDAGDVLADPLFEYRPPRHQAEPEPVVDHGVAPAYEIGRPRERAADVFAGLGRPESEAALLRHLLPYPLDLLAFQDADEVPRQRKGAVRLHLGVADGNKPLGEPFAKEGDLLLAMLPDECGCSLSAVRRN
jgi:hypothetical protein